MTYSLQNSPRIVCVDLPESDEELLRFAWRLANVAYDMIENGGLTYNQYTERDEPLTPDGLHTLVFNVLLQLRDDGIETIMNDTDRQQPR